MYLTKNIKKENIPYIVTWIIYYAWVIVFTTWWTSSPITDKLMGTDSRVILHSLTLLSSAVFIFIIKKEWFKNFSYIGGFFVLLFSILSMLKTNYELHTISIILLAVSLGLFNIVILIPMIYILNNSEKLLAIIGANLLISVLSFLQEQSILTIRNGLIFSFVMLLFSIIPIIYFKLSDFEKNKPIKINNKLNSIMYLSIILNCVYAILCKGIGKAFVMSAIKSDSINLYPIYYIGAIVGCLICFLLYKVIKASSYVSWNITFGLFTIAMFIYSIASSTELNYVFSILMGIVSTMGMINMYYMLGVIGKMYWNHLYVKLSILLIGILGGVSGTLFGNAINNGNKLSIGIGTSIISVSIIILFLVVSPTFFKSYYIEENQTLEKNNDMINNYLIKFGLSNRERELCKLLIDGYTLRQASAMMSIRYNTANSYCKGIYKKMEVNSKIELINKFKRNI